MTSSEIAVLAITPHLIRCTDPTLPIVERTHFIQCTGKIVRDPRTPPFNPSVAMQVLCSCMNGAVVGAMADEGGRPTDDSSSKAAVEDALMAYVRFHHMLLFLADRCVLVHYYF
jgi:hypothetical protein